ncbi:uncharacterized protein KGF55_000610 [Candida pseudojiufengensis]|uniref:uncharacterized protein n=1 Tax=Candida pseudojiufengensis TaxID=497109 RepID=UPI0022253EE7|nr:uncharacterized protein KGF55_000610 [Candida pseudojiufengensis]KAI5966301.1 hypothetical protein KGF55_000610 [Candida pseudojiufengensis]
MTDILRKKSEDFYKLIKKVVANVELSNLSGESSNFKKFNKFKTQLNRILKNDGSLRLPQSQDNEIAEEHVVNEIEKYNTQLDSSFDEFIVTTGSQKFIQSIIHDYVEDEDKDQSHFHQQLDTVLDFTLWLAIDLELPVKSSYYQNLLFISSQLISLSVGELSLFWTYLESRMAMIKNKLFTGTTSERMYILELGNFLTDYFQTSGYGDKTNSIEKDTNNDIIQARVRTLMTNLLEFEDSTGRNKYFRFGNRITPKITMKDKFLSDVMDIQKIFNDPIFYMKKENYKDLHKMSDKIHAVYDVLLKEYKSYRAKLNEPDQFTKKPKVLESEARYLCKKFESKKYVPETYIGAVAENHKADVDFLFNQLESPKIKLLYIAQIFILAGLYSESAPQTKRDFLRSIGAPTNSKHLTDETVNNTTAKTFFELKKDISNNLRLADSQTMFLFQSLHFGEKSWWGLLLKGKDSDIQNIFADKMITPEEAENIQEKHLSLYPYKSKKNFNTYITPQVSKKMRKSRGLENLRKRVDFDAKKAEEDNIRISDQLNDEDSMEDKTELKEKKSSNSWKILRKRRYDLVN